MDDDFDFPSASNAADEMGMDEELDLPETNQVIKVGEEQEIGKNGLKKKLINEGEGWENPSSGDEVEGKVISCFGSLNPIVVEISHIHLPINQFLSRLLMG